MIIKNITSPSGANKPFAPDVCSELTENFHEGIEQNMRPLFVLTKKGLSRLQFHHPWVFVSDIQTSCADSQPGDIVSVGDSRSVHCWAFLGSGPALKLRVISWGETPPDIGVLLREKLAFALHFRRRWQTGDDAFRWVHGEADGLSGLIVDVYGNVVCIQTLALGWRIRLDTVIASLKDVISSEALIPGGCRAFILRNDVRHLDKEGVSKGIFIIEGDLKEDESKVVRLGDVMSHVFPLKGQKTGLYLDVRNFPRSLCGVFLGARVLDAFCYYGCFSLHALKCGAKKVVSIDQSQDALDVLTLNLTLNSMAQNVQCVHGNVFDRLRELEHSGEKFDVAVMDPPPFAPGKGKTDSAHRGYKELALRSFKLLNKGGTLLLCSCSHAFTREMLYKAMLEAAHDAGRDFSIVGEMSQPADHPTSSFMPESSYLKGFLACCR